MHSHRIEKVLDQVGDLPAMPELVSEVLELTNDPLVDMNEVAIILAKDPGLTAKILRISNSPYYGMKQYVGTLKLALVILGVREVRNIVLGVSVFDALNGAHRNPASQVQFVSHSFVVGGLAKGLAMKLSLGMQGEAFISGLLHDIGKLILTQQVGDRYVNLMKKYGADREAFVLAEADTFGFTHADVGAALGTRWNFPQPLRDAIHLHHPLADAPLSSSKDPRLAAVVRIANLASHFNFDAEGAKFGDESDLEAWTILDGLATRIEPGDRHSTLAGAVAELRASGPPQY